MKRSLTRILFILIIRLIDGYTKAKILKKLAYFNTQGDNCYFASSNFGTEPYLVSLGDNVYFAAGVRLVTHDMSAKVVQDISGIKGLHKFGHIKIGSNVFIGLDAIVMPGIIICNDVIVSAGAIVSKNINESGVYAGIPAKKIMDMDAYVDKIIILNASYPWRNNNKSPTKADLIEYFFGE